MKDLLATTTGDLNLAGADFNIGKSDFQHQEHLLIGQKGSVKQYPDACVGIEDFVNDGDIDEMLSAIRAEFTKDGMTVNSIRYDDTTGDLDYDAKYNS
jgi:hypothetical protein